MLRGWRIACVLALAGCLSKPSPGTSTDAGIDAAPRCTTWGMFSTPVRLPMEVQSTADDWGPTPTYGDLELYFYSYRTGGNGSAFWVSTRTKTTDSFGIAARVGELDSADDEKAITLTANGLDAVFERDGVAGIDLYETVRMTPTGQFTNVMPLSINTPYAETDPWLSADGLDLVFASTSASNQNATLDLFETSRTAVSGDFQAPTELVTVDEQDVNENSPTISADRLELFYSSQRMGGLGGFDVYRCDRSSPTGQWSSGKQVVELSSPGDDVGLRLSQDGTTMYMNYNADSTGAGNADLYVATRMCVQ